MSLVFSLKYFLLVTGNKLAFTDHPLRVRYLKINSWASHWSYEDRSLDVNTILCTSCPGNTDGS